MKITNKQIVKHWLVLAYGEVDGNYQDYLDRVESIGIEKWTKELIPVKSIQTHHEGHDASDEYIEDYIKMKESGSAFPSIIVQKINDDLYITIDGQHRVKAAEHLKEEFIEAYVGVISSQSSEDRKNNFKERHSVEFISQYGKTIEESKQIQIEAFKFIDERYTEERPWSSLFFHINPYHFLEWFLENQYNEN